MIRREPADGDEVEGAPAGVHVVLAQLRVGVGRPPHRGRLGRHPVIVRPVRRQIRAHPLRLRRDAHLPHPGHEAGRRGGHHGGDVVARPGRGDRDGADGHRVRIHRHARGRLEHDRRLLRRRPRARHLVEGALEHDRDRLPVDLEPGPVHARDHEPVGQRIAGLDEVLHRGGDRLRLERRHGRLGHLAEAIRVGAGQILPELTLRVLVDRPHPGVEPRRRCGDRPGRRVGAGTGEGDRLDPGDRRTDRRRVRLRRLLVERAVERPGRGDRDAGAVEDRPGALGHRHRELVDERVALADESGGDLRADDRLEVQVDPRRLCRGREVPRRARDRGDRALLPGTGRVEVDLRPVPLGRDRHGRADLIPRRPVGRGAGDAELARAEGLGSRAVAERRTGQVRRALQMRGVRGHRQGTRVLVGHLDRQRQRRVRHRVGRGLRAHLRQQRLDRRPRPAWSAGDVVGVPGHPVAVVDAGIGDPPDVHCDRGRHVRIAGLAPASEHVVQLRELLARQRVQRGDGVRTRGRGERDVQAEVDAVHLAAVVGLVGAEPALTDVVADTVGAGVGRLRGDEQAAECQQQRDDHRQHRAHAGPPRRIPDPGRAGQDCRRHGLSFFRARASGKRRRRRRCMTRLRCRLGPCPREGPGPGESPEPRNHIA